MNVHLVDGTYELFRHYFAVPASKGADGQEMGAARGVVGSVLLMLEGGATHVGVATDHVVESFRNELYDGYKTSEGVPEDLLSQFPLVEEALGGLGVRVWAESYFEADDALASAAAESAKDKRVQQVLVCTPDKDLAQCVVGERVVQVDRRREIVRGEKEVVEKFGVKPSSIPDWLAVVGDSADGYPGIAGWGEKGAAAVLGRYERLEGIPKLWMDWHPSIRKAKGLAQALFDNWEDALLFRRLATLRLDVPVFERVEELRWKGPRPGFEELCRRMKAPKMFERAMKAAAVK